MKKHNDTHSEFTQSSRRRFLQGSIGAILAGPVLSRFAMAKDSKRLLGAESPAAEGAAMPFRIGAAEADITPTWSTELFGYDARTDPSKGVYQPIKTRVMTISDGKNTVVLMMADLVCWDLRKEPKGIISAIHAELKKRHNLNPEQIIMVASHTHCAPNPKDKKVCELVIERAVQAVDEAFKNAREARLFFGRGYTNIGVSRRAHNIDGENVWEMNPYGVHDHEIVVMKAVDRAGKPVAATFSYSCHPTTMGGLYFGGDYPGFAQLEIQKRIGGAPALFLQGAAGDAKPRNPDPKNPLLFKGPDQATVADVERIGLQFAQDVAKALEAPMEEITGSIRSSFETIQVPVMSASKMTESGDPEYKLDPANPFSGPQRRMARQAKALLDSLDAKANYSEMQPWDIQVMRIGSKFIHIGLGGEVCASIGLRVKDQLRGNQVMVTGYTNYDTDYFPGQADLASGGYEVFYNPHHKPYSPEAEDILVCNIMETVKRLA